MFALLVAPAGDRPADSPRARWQGCALSVVFALLVAWLGLGVAYFSIYPVGFYMTTFAFGLYAAVRTTRWALGRRV